MNNLLKYSMLALVLGLIASANAHATVGSWAGPPPMPKRAVPNVAPEIDPNLAIAGFGLLAGTLTVVRSRRRR